MNRRQLKNLGVPDHIMEEVQTAISNASREMKFKRREIEIAVRRMLDDPASCIADPYFGPAAKGMLAPPEEDVAREPVPFQEWGSEHLDEGSRQQMRDACSLPVSVMGALMPDAHVGYGLPIGGVLATENAVIPYAVGVDIACRMKLSLVDLPVSTFEKNPDLLDKALADGTRFGVGVAWKRPQEHEVLDADWTATHHLKGLKDLAAQQLGTSGSGNHFVEWGIVNLPQSDLGLEPGRYVALLSHSGSRGPGARTCDHYSALAARKLHPKYAELSKLAWLSLDSEEGQEYWTAMNLMGEFASANHAVIHRNVLKAAGAHAIGGVENHHNFAWKEQHLGRELIVHRKGATPAGAGVLGVIPGNMADSCFIVRGKGNDASLHSAAHGAGRCMSRTEAKRRFNWGSWRDYIKNRGVRLLAAGLDEVPGVYKDIHEVMRAQDDLVDVVGTFQPKVVMMCGDGSKAED